MVEMSTKKLVWCAATILFYCRICQCTPMFMEAISSALATVPLTAFPIGTGLVGAKLAVGAKLLYFLGYFGRGETPMAKEPFQSSIGNPMSNIPSHLNMGSTGYLPLPYYLGGRSQHPFQGMKQSISGLSTSNYGAFDPNLLIAALKSEGIDPLELTRALASSNVNLNQLLRAIDSVLPSRFQGFVNSGNTQWPTNPVDMTDQPVNENEGNVHTYISPSDENDPPKEEEGAKSEDIESFFSFLKDMDDNTCISRLVCDIGFNPDFLGEFSQNINGIISALEVPLASIANEYIDIMEGGKLGNCAEKFQSCTDAAYDIVKSVAPTVGVPGANI